MVKTIDVKVTIDIEIARKMLNVAGYYVDKMTDDEVLNLALSMNDEYGVSYDKESLLKKGQ